MFNPFGKDFNTLNEEDLQVLRTISEGWYIEYKSIQLDAKKIAKSIASFSNSYGGLYILGVEADKQNCAIAFPGVDSRLDIIHDAVKGNLNPFPYFDCYTVNLKNGNYVIIVAVKEGIDPPYIHSDGRIYRRQESASDLIIHETNRYAIDKLYEKAEKYKENLKKFRTIDYGFCKGEDNWSYLIGYVNTRRFEKSIIDDFQLSGFPSKIINIFNEEFNIDEEGLGQINGRCCFNNITLFSDSLIIRNISNIAYNTLTIELFKNGNMKFMLPINTIRLPDTSTAARIEQFCKDHHFTDFDVIKWVSLGDFLTSIISIFIPYFRFLKNYNCYEDIEVVFEGSNIWRICLFSEEDRYFDYIQEFSLPVILKDNIIYPEKAFEVRFAGEGEGGRGYIAALLSILGVASSGFGMPAVTSLEIFLTEGNKKAKQL